MVRTIHRASQGCLGWLFMVGLVMIIWMWLTVLLPTSPSWIVAVIVGLTAGVIYASLGREV